MMNPAQSFLAPLAADVSQPGPMVALSFIALILGIGLYAAASVLFFLDVAKSGAAQRASLGAPKDGLPTQRSRASVPPPKAVQRAPLLLAAGAAAHFGYITEASFVAHVCPIDSVHFMLSITAILASFGYLGARAIYGRVNANGVKRANLDALGLLIAPLGLAFLLGTYFLGRPSGDHDVGRSLGPLFMVLHVLVNLVGVALFVLAGAAATLYLVQEKRLKQKRLAKIGNLPPLDTLDRAVHRFLIAGFPFLTIGIVSGTFWARQLEFGSANEVMRIVFGYATWLAFAAVLLLRAAAGWRGRRSAYGTILGLFCTMAVLAVYLTRPEPAPLKQGSGLRSIAPTPVARASGSATARPREGG